MEKGLMSLMMKILDEVKKETSTCRHGMHALTCRGSQRFIGAVLYQQQFSFTGESRGMSTAPQVSSNPLERKNIITLLHDSCNCSSVFQERWNR